MDHEPRSLPSRPGVATSFGKITCNDGADHFPTSHKSPNRLGTAQVGAAQQVLDAPYANSSSPAVGAIEVTSVAVAAGEGGKVSFATTPSLAQLSHIHSTGSRDQARRRLGRYSATTLCPRALVLDPRAQLGPRVGEPGASLLTLFFRRPPFSLTFAFGGWVGPEETGPHHPLFATDAVANGGHVKPHAINSKAGAYPWVWA
ncbi:hypothetical protein GQX73_g4703 [Xylaria multiplex]|uniref:Uncharacterized protein n=1 Tax=Xylaria multiplex TaxID=323545 RepID=A0A7C8MVA5_9PEZI|nr:hypothetical protein GQX73_g4703 [Xylaria multiplex]